MATDSKTRSKNATTASPSSWTGTTTETRGVTPGDGSHADPAAEEVPDVDDGRARGQARVFAVGRTDDEEIGRGDDLAQGKEVGVVVDIRVGADNPRRLEAQDPLQLVAQTRTRV